MGWPCRGPPTPVSGGGGGRTHTRLQASLWSRRNTHSYVLSGCVQGVLCLILCLVLLMAAVASNLLFQLVNIDFLFVIGIQLYFKHIEDCNVSRVTHSSFIDFFNTLALSVC